MHMVGKIARLASRTLRPHASHQHESYDPEDRARNPCGEVWRYESLAADRLGELDKHEEDDRRREADADAIRRTATLRARREWRAEEGDDEAGRRNRDLERPLDAEQVRVAPGALLRANETRELLVTHLLGAARLRHHLDRTLGETPVAEAVEGDGEARRRSIRDDLEVAAAKGPTVLLVVARGAGRENVRWVIGAISFPLDLRLIHRAGVGVERADFVDAPVLAGKGEVVAGGLHRRDGLRLEEIGAALIGDRHDLAEGEIETAGENGADEDRRDETIEADPGRLRGGDLRVPREAADGEDGGEEHRCGKDHEHRIREPVDVAHDDVLPRQVAAEVLVQVVREIDDDEQQRKPECRGNEDLPELEKDVPVQRPHDAHQATLRRRSSGIPTFRPTRANHIRIVSISSPMSPPRPVDASRPIRRVSTRPMPVMITFVPHIAQNAEM